MRHTPIATVLALLLGFPILAANPICAQSSSPSTDSLDAAVHLDSLDAALDRFKRADPPSPGDTAGVKRWAGPLHSHTKTEKLHYTRPEDASTWLKHLVDAWSAVQDSTRLASALGGLGVATYNQGRTRDAVEIFKQVADLQEQLGNLETAGRALNNIGRTLEQLGEYRGALNNLREAVRIFRSLDNRELVAWGLTHIGNIREQQGEFRQAETRYREALSIHREVGNRSGEAAALHNVALSLRKQEQLDDALSYLKQALAINRAEEDRESIALNLNSIGSIQRRQGRLDEARASVSEALAIQREIEDHSRIPISLHSLGAISSASGRSQEAMAYFREALALNRDLAQRRSVAANLENIGRIHLDRGNYTAAAETLRASVQLVEEVRVNATSPASRRSLLSTEIEGYRALTTATIRAGQPEDALRVAERTRARVLADYLSGTEDDTGIRPVPPTDSLQATLAPNEAAVLYAEVTNGLAALVVSADTIATRLLPVASSGAASDDLQPATDNRAREQAVEPAPKDPSVDGDDANLDVLADEVRRFRRQLVNPYGRDSTFYRLSRTLYDRLVAPLNPLLAEKDRLVIVPAGVLGYLPFGTLKDESGAHLIETRHVRYTPSLTVLRQLQHRSYGPRLRPLLALGGPAYGNSLPSRPRPVALAGTATETRAEAPDQARPAQTASPAEAIATAPEPPARSYAELGYGRWPDLPGTLREAQKLTRITGPGATMLTGTQASERTLRRLNRGGELRDYRILHFATHGVVVSNRPNLSSLVLARAAASDTISTRDGYLTRKEIAELDLRADLAVLSACQTGLGPYIDGEGVVGLSDAFLRAGANATLVSQWSVQDESTRQFMMGVYQRAKAPGMSFARAVTETKRAFLRGEYGERNRDPIRWAPFVYYGRD